MLATGVVLVLTFFYVAGIILSLIYPSPSTPDWFLVGAIYIGIFLGFRELFSKLFERVWGEWYRTLRSRNQPTLNRETNQPST